MEGKGSHMAAVVGIVALLIGGVIGYVVADGSEMSNNNETEQTTATDTAAADLRVSLNNALREHVSLGATTLRAVFDGSENAEALVGTLDENSVEVAGLVGSVYGDEAEQQFLDLWRQHINFFANYTTAAKNGNQEGMDQALQDLAGYSDEASTFFANANENLPKDAVQPLLAEHRDLVIEAVNEYGAGDLEASYDAEQRARDQVGEIANALAAGIVAQNPDNF